MGGYHIECKQVVGFEQVFPIFAKRRFSKPFATSSPNTRVCFCL